jgi:hypothetical protein
MVTSPQQSDGLIIRRDSVDYGKERGELWRLEAFSTNWFRFEFRASSSTLGFVRCSISDVEKRGCRIPSAADAPPGRSLNTASEMRSMTSALNLFYWKALA